MIDEKRILKNLEAFSFPRLSGTDFERECCNLAIKKIEDLNLTPTVQEFLFSTFYSRVFPKLSLILLSWLLFVLFLKVNFIFMAINLLLIFFLLPILFVYTRNPERIQVGKMHSSQNVFAKIPRKNNKHLSQNDNLNEFSENTKNILFFAHLDSKGQSITLKIRVSSYKIWIDSFLIGLLIIFINAIIFDNTVLILHILVGLSLIFNFIALGIISINTTNNKSMGAIDNASGICCVLELLSYYVKPENRLENFNLWFVFTGAEESGTMGVRNFYKYIQNLDRTKNFIINFDSIANHALLYNHDLINKNNFKSYQYVLENKEFFSLTGVKKVYIGTYSDGIFLQNRKFKGLGIGDYGSYRYVHSAEDNITNMNIIVLKILCQFLTILLKDIDY